MYKDTAKRLSIVIGVVSNIVKNSYKTASMQANNFHHSAKIYLGELRAVFVDRRTNSVLDVFDFLNVPMSHTRKIGIRLLETFFISVCFAQL